MLSDVAMCETIRQIVDRVGVDYETNAGRSLLNAHHGHDGSHRVRRILDIGVPSSLAAAVSLTSLLD